MTWLEESPGARWRSADRRFLVTRELIGRGSVRFRLGVLAPGSGGDDGLIYEGKGLFVSPGAAKAFAARLAEAA